MRDLTSIRRSLQLLCVISLFVTAYFAKDLILPVLLGFLLALTLSPVARSMNRLGIPSGVAAFALVGLAGTAIVVVAALSASTIASWSDELPGMGRQIERKLASMAETVETVRETTKKVEELSESNDPDRPEKVLVEQPGLLSNAMSTGFKLGSTLLVTLILALFLLGSGSFFYVKLVQSFQSITEKKRALHAVYDVEKRVSRYLLTITVINAGLGLCVGAYLYVLGLPGAITFGIAAFLLNFIPYIGGLAGALIAGAYAIIAFDTVGYALLAPLGYLVLTSIEGQILTPWLVGKRLEMNTVAVFLTVVFWGWLWGLAGAVIAVPFLVVFKVVCENVTALHIIGNFLGNSLDGTAETEVEEQARAS